MVRPPRTDFEGAWHHVMNRGARKAPIFNADEHCGLFLQILGTLPPRFGVEVHAYSLMPNHFHLLVHSVRGELSRAMRHLGGYYTQEINRLHGWDGPIFRGRFRSQLVHGTVHLLTVAAYIHLNPIRAGLVKRLDQHCWTSHRAYLGLDLPPGWLCREVVLAEAGGAAAFDELVYSYRVNRRPWPESIDRLSGGLNRSATMPDPLRPIPPISDQGAPPLLPSADVLKSVCASTGASASDLRRADYGRGKNRARRFAAWALWRSSGLTHREIGQQLGMSAGQVAKVISSIRARPADVSEWMDAWDAKVGSG